METARVSILIRLRPEVMQRARKQAKKEKKSFNAYVENLLDRETRLNWAVMPEDYQIDEEILRLSIPGFRLPSQEEIDADPKLSHLLAYLKDE